MCRILLFLFVFLLLQSSTGKAFAQKGFSLAKEEKELTKIFMSIVNGAYENQDTLDHYRGLFTNRMKAMFTRHPESFSYPFKTLADSQVCWVLTSADGLLRIYSWDTWTGGTMHFYKNIFQYKAPKGIRTFVQDFGDEDPGGYYSHLFTVKTAQQTYYLALSNSRLSNKDRTQNLEVFAIIADRLDDKARLIKTKSGLQHDIGFEYNFFSIEDTGHFYEMLIRYDPVQQIITLPVVYENGQVTKNTIRYKFTGKYFEKM